MLSAFPADRVDFRAHPRSQSVRELGWRLVGSVAHWTDAILEAAEPTAPPALPVPAEWEAVLDGFRSAARGFSTRLQDTSESDLAARIRFSAVPGSVCELPRGQALWFVLIDTVHRRRQLSVHLWLAGERVPALPCPSRDGQGA